MGVLIKDMAMPKRCGGCFLRVGECKQRIYMEDRPHDCPLVPVPPHGRLIDADALAKKMRGVVFRGEEKDVLHHNVQAFLDAPTIIEAEEGE